MSEYNGCINLAAAVIKQAISDLSYIEKYKSRDKFYSIERNYKSIGWDAYNFLNGEGLQKWCDILGLSADYIRKEIGKTSDLFKKSAFTCKS